MNPELNDTGSWEEVNGKAFVRCEDCCVVAQNRKLRMSHPGHLQCIYLLRLNGVLSVCDISGV